MLTLTLRYFWTVIKLKMQIKEFAGFTGVSVRTLHYKDERFKNNFDKHADGTAAFIYEAVEVYCRK